LPSSVFNQSNEHSDVSADTPKDNFQCLNHISNLKHGTFNNVNQWLRQVNKNESGFRILHSNIRSLRKNWDSFLCTVGNDLAYFDVIVLTECNISEVEGNFYNINGYEKLAEYKPGGVIVFIRSHYSFKRITVSLTSCDIVHLKNVLMGISLNIFAVYRHPKSNLDLFISEIGSLLEPLKGDAIFIGDINIDLNHYKNSKANKYEMVLAQNGFIRSIFDFTREEKSGDCWTQSCIDHLFVRSTSEISSAVITSKVSDHYMIAAEIRSAWNAETKKGSSKVCCYNKQMISNLLAEVSLSAPENCSADGMYENLRGTITEVLKKSRFLPKNNKYCNLMKKACKPWFNRRIQSLASERDKLFKKLKQNKKNTKLKILYRKKRNQVNQIISKSKKAYFEQKFKENQNDVKKSWKLVNSILGRSAPSVDDTLDSHLGNNLSKTEITNSFIDSFVHEVEILKHDCNLQLLTTNRPIKVVNSFFLPKASSTKIQLIISSLSSNKSSGYDEIRATEIKILAVKETNLLFITDLINKCISEGSVPEMLKVSVCRPIYKSGSYLDFKNYRPIAIQSVLDLVLEKYLSEKLLDYVEKYHLIDPCQYAYQREKGTEDLLDDFTSFIYNKLSNGQFVLCLFLDFTKAFDTIIHEKLFVILESIGVRGLPLKLIKNYLSGRKMTVRFKDNFSKLSEIKQGVPQGSILGPLLFLIYANQLLKLSTFCKTFMYADDIVLLCPNINIEDAKSQLQQDFNNILKWSHDYGLIINSNKSKVMCISSPHNKIEVNKSIKSHTFDCLHKLRDPTFSVSDDCDCPLLDIVSNFKYLGVMMDCTFNWNLQLDLLKQRLMNIMIMLYHLNLHAPRQVVKRAYTALAESTIRYGILAWGNASKTKLEKIKNIQERMLKIVSGIDRRSDFKVDPFFDLQVLDVFDIHKYTILTKNCFSNKFKSAVSLDKQTRSTKQMQYVVPFSASTFKDKTKEVLVPKIFNLIPLDLHLINSKSKFKKETKRWLINNHLK